MRDPFKKLIANVRNCGANFRNGKWVLSNTSQKSTKINYDPPKVYIDDRDLKKIWSHQKGKCYWLGIDIPIHAIFESYHPLSMSVDRLDNAKDYMVDNIVICCRFANLGRGSYDAVLFSDTVNYIRNGISEVDHSLLKIDKNPNTLWQV